MPTYAKGESVGESTGFKLPRFVSTKSDESNLRIGASTNYPIQLTYILKNFPLEIIDEYDKWRKVVDVEGNQGWMHKSILQGGRYAIIKTFHNQPAQIYNKPKGVPIGKIGNRNIVKINKCLISWCQINYENNIGWINKINLWGVYKNEKFNLPFYQFIIKIYWNFF